MNSFFEFDMESMGGVVEFNFSPIENIAVIPDAVNDCISTPITFSGANIFFQGKALRDSLNFSEKQKITNAGENFITEVTGMVPKLTVPYLNIFNEMKRHRFVLLVTDNNGLLRLCGTKEKGMRFSFDQDSKNRPGLLSGFQFSFTLESDKSSPFYFSTFPTLNIGTPVYNYPQGQKGDSAYQVWLANGNTGSEADFLASLEGTDGNDGREVEFQKSATHIQWRFLGEVTWNDLVALADLKGDDGADGAKNGIGNPNGVVTPDFIGQTYIDTVAGIVYTSTGLTNADWITGGGSSTSNAEHRARYLISQTMLKY